MFSKLFLKMRSGFTLFELTVVVGIVSVLSGLVYITVQPAELLARSRDSQRISDINQISTLIAQKNTQQIRVRSLGATSTFYISLPSTNSDCSDLISFLPTLPAGSSYHCVPQEQLRNVNGTGWIPVDFTADKLSALPIDSVNSASQGLYYVYTNTGTGHYELSTLLESKQIKSENGIKDGGLNANAYEAGSSLSIIPNTESIGGTLLIVCSAGATRTMYQPSSVACGTSCSSETQTCNGTGTGWSGTYTQGLCTASTRTAYQANTSACGTYNYASESQSCQSSGAWSGTYTSISVPTVTTRTRYSALTSACGTYGATSETQTCQSNGSFDGTFTLTSEPAITTQTRYASLTSACGTYGSNSESQSCLSNGSFSGTYTLTSAPSVTTRTRYTANTSACGTYGSSSETQTCQSGGSFSGSYTLTSAPSATTRTMYAASSVACGSSCSSQTQTCQSSGSWTGTYAYGSCSAQTSQTYYLDSDGDGYPVSGTYTTACTPPAGYVASSGSWDCDDTNASIYPGTTRTRYSSSSVSCGSSCSSVAETQTCQSNATWSGSYSYTSCNVASGATYYRDYDGDGYGNPSVTTTACGAPTGYVSNNTDCNDTYASINPGVVLYHSDARPDGGYDWNCDGVETKYSTSGQITTCEGGDACSGYSIYWLDGSTCSYDSYRSSTNCVSTGSTLSLASQACGSLYYYGDFSSAYTTGSRADNSCTTYNPTLYFCTSWSQQCR